MSFRIFRVFGIFGISRISGIFRRFGCFVIALGAVYHSIYKLQRVEISISAMNALTVVRKDFLNEKVFFFFK